ncbi:hypothetical protein ACPOLB_21140 [Rubrivivax sp. RP6-9]|uniref:hypothetical protein n=1 Tax=Rubrivivax sp. RP6-9 TaxID=3415750 RepID=UPI003CC532A2
MPARPLPLPALLITAAAAATLGAGCATAPPAGNRIAAPPMGTVTTYHRKSSGSLGDFDGRVVWTHAAGSWQGRPMVAFGSAQGTSLHDPQSFALVASLGATGQPLASYDPPIDYAWPLQVGKTWTASTTVTQHPAGRTVPLTTTYRVESWGDVTVPAGTFKAYKLVWSNNFGEVETRWVGVADGIATVKRHVERPATHPQGAGVLDAELLSVQAPR